MELVASGEPEAVLELGVGTGYFALPLLERLPKVTVHGLDVEPRMLEVFGSRAGDRGVAERVRLVEAELAGARSVPLEEGSIDAVLLANLWHELDDRPGVLAAVARVLRTSGKLVLCDWDPAAAGDWGPPADHRVAADDTEADLAAAGFATITRHDLYDGFYTFLAER